MMDSPSLSTMFNLNVAPVIEMFAVSPSMEDKVNVTDPLGRFTISSIMVMVNDTVGSPATKSTTILPDDCAGVVV